MAHSHIDLISGDGNKTNFPDLGSKPPRPDKAFYAVDVDDVTRFTGNEKETKAFLRGFRDRSNLVVRPVHLTEELMQEEEAEARKVKRYQRGFG